MKLNKMVKIQALLKKGNQVWVSRDFRGAYQEMDLADGKLPFNRRYGIIESLGLKGDEIIVEYSCLGWQEKWFDAETNKEEVKFVVYDNDKDDLPDEPKMWCYLNQIFRIEDNRTNKSWEMKIRKGE